jgi:hypothetical protein
MGANILHTSSPNTVQSAVAVPQCQQHLPSHLLGISLPCFVTRGWGRERRKSTLALLMTYGWMPVDVLVE